MFDELIIHTNGDDEGDGRQSSSSRILDILNTLIFAFKYILEIIWVSVVHSLEIFFKKIMLPSAYLVLSTVLGVYTWTHLILKKTPWGWCYTILWMSKWRHKVLELGLNHMQSGFKSTCLSLQNCLTVRSHSVMSIYRWEHCFLYEIILLFLSCNS